MKKTIVTTSLTTLALILVSIQAHASTYECIVQNMRLIDASTGDYQGQQTTVKTTENKTTVIGDTVVKVVTEIRDAGKRRIEITSLSQNADAPTADEDSVGSAKELIRASSYLTNGQGTVLLEKGSEYVQADCKILK